MDKNCISKPKNSRRAQELFWEYGVCPKDSVHVFTAVHLKVGRLYLYDKNLIRLSSLATTRGEIMILNLPTSSERGELDLRSPET